MNISLRGRKSLDNLPFTQKSWLLNLQATSSSLSFWETVLHMKIQCLLAMLTKPYFFVKEVVRMEAVNKLW